MKLGTKLSRSQMRPYTMKLLKEQGGLCPLCMEPISMSLTEGHKTDFALDHCHETGRIRGVLHRSCNGAEGKVANAAGRWGAKSMQSESILAFLKRLIEYYETPLKDYVYPTHKSAEENAEAQRVKRNKAAALRRAQLKAKGIGR